MLLAVNIGNTRVNLGLWATQSLVKTYSLPTLLAQNADPFFQALQSCDIPYQQLSAIAIASVVPPINSNVIQALRQTAPHLNPDLLLSTDPIYHFEIQTDAPETTGTDLLMNTEAAIREYTFPCIIVDSGTATTFCAISKNKNQQAVFLGAAFTLGLKLTMETLAQHTAQLFQIPLEPPQKAIGQNTVNALRSGLILGTASLIDGMIQRFRAELAEAHPQPLPSPLPVIATGGMHPLWKKLSREITHCDPYLTLKGIAYAHASLLARKPHVLTH